MRWHVAAAVIATGTIAVAFRIADRPPSRNIGHGPGRACTLPPRRCVEHCDELVEMPLLGFGYVDVRVEEEVIPATSTSYLRRDLMMAVQYAAAKVACKAATWNTGIGGPIALGDMSERDGSTPGTIWGRPRHPPHTHTDGLALDIAYFQRGTPDNHLRPICPHIARGNEQWHCVAAPTRLDAWRTALFLGALLEEPDVRVIGVDGRAGRPILAAFRELCVTGWIDPAACRNNKIRYETRNADHGWYHGHHNHLHVAWSAAGRR